jgi:SagB-type dehydrogenase family enzyme
LIVSNREIQAAQNYHAGTKHPNGYLMDPSHYYHPSLEPLKFKIYQGTELIALPQPEGSLGMPALQAIAATALLPGNERIPTLEALSRILYYSAGVTKKIDYPGGEFYFRAAACTGALYHIEIYLACGELPGLPAGLYHYEPQAHGLTKLRQGDFRRCLIEASGDEPAMEAAPAVLIFTDVFWRNAVKYQARAYRHTFWDGGTISTMAVCAAQDLSAGWCWVLLTAGQWLPDSTWKRSLARSQGKRRVCQRRPRRKSRRSTTQFYRLAAGGR